MTGLNRLVGASYGTQPQVNRRVEEASVASRRDERLRLAHAMPPKDITLTPDATFTGGLWPGRDGPREPLHLLGASGSRPCSGYLAGAAGAGAVGAQLSGDPIDQR